MMAGYVQRYCTVACGNVYTVTSHRGPIDSMYWRVTRTGHDGYYGYSSTDPMLVMERYGKLLDSPCHDPNCRGHYYDYRIDFAWEVIHSLP